MQEIYINESDLHSDGGLLRLTGTPQDQRKHREKYYESHNKSEKIATSRKGSVYGFSAEKPLLFNGVKFLPGLPGLAFILALVLGLEGSREASGG